MNQRQKAIELAANGKWMDKVFGPKGRWPSATGAKTSWLPVRTPKKYYAGDLVARTDSRNRDRDAKYWFVAAINRFGGIRWGQYIVLDEEGRLRKLNQIKPYAER